VTVGSSRFVTYRDEEGYEIPADMQIEVCDACGTVWMTSEQIDELSKAFEAERERRAVKP
jgi:NMD protein affecting ribosome stability and mRNA decay